ncbi:MAG: glycosyltransferase family 2 protein [Candidatus Liptonbacteria bacterium]|nr:glycosyltransferase family 2 protein [Candidatus Liptonbacteria bacterium]
MSMHRFFEILPGTLAWLTLILIVIFSRWLPVFTSVFIILFDIYWLLKTVYLSLHLRSTFSAMKKNLKVNWLSKLEELENNANVTNNGTNATNKIRSIRTPFVDSNYGMSWRDIYHLVILPMYREPYEVVRESFESLVNANYPKEKFIVVLATEERGGRAAEETARKIEREFGSQFFKFLLTKHPWDISGEIPGKGSNETWAAKEAKRLIIDPLLEAQSKSVPELTLEAKLCENQAKQRENFRKDSRMDSHSFAYGNVLVSVFDIDTQIFPEYFGRLTYVFLNAPNRLRAIYQPIPLFTNNIYKAPALARVIAFSSTFWQMMQQARAERLTSFSSQSLPFPVLLDIGFWHTDVVSEDSRIFWQGYLRYHGDFRVEPLLYPVSMDANVAPGFWETMKNNYRQHRRWAWGCENIPYMLDGFRKDPLIPKIKKWYWSFNAIEGFHSWATNALMIFALGWLPVLLGGKHFNASLLSYSLPQITKFIIQLSMLGVASSAIVSILLLPPRPKWFRWHHYFLYFLQWIFIPATLIVFGAFPALEAQTRLALGGKWRLGFWPTPKSRSEIMRK